MATTPNNNSSKDAQAYYKAMAKVAEIQKKYNVDLRESEKTLGNITDLSKEWEDQYKGVYSITNAILGLNKTQLLTSKATKEQLDQFKSTLIDIKNTYDDVIKRVNIGFTSALKLNNANAKILITTLNQGTPKMAEMGEELKKALKTKDFKPFTEMFGKEGIEKLIEISSEKGFIDLRKFFVDSPLKAAILREAMEGTVDAIKSGSDKAFKMSHAIEQISTNLQKQYFNWTKIVERLMEFDQGMSDIQGQFNVLNTNGIIKTSEAMSDLTQSGALYGVSIKDSFKSVEEVANLWRTDNLPAVVAVVKETQSFSKALGTSLEDVNAITGNMLFMGDSAENIVFAFKDIAKYSSLFKINGKEVTSEFAKTLPKFQRMGFKEGVTDLARMVAESKKLGINIDEVMQSADKFYFSLDDSIDAASTLQMLGGQFSNIGAFDLMATAQKGPEALTQMYKKMVSDVGKMNDKGEFSVDPVSKVRMQEAAKALGISYDTLFNLARGNAEEMQKLKYFPKDMFAGITDKDQRDFLLNSMNLKTHKVEVDGKVYGMEDLAKMNAATVKQLMEDHTTQAKNLETRNMQNQSLKDSFTAFVDTLLNAFTPFEPFIKVLTSVMQVITKGMNWIPNKLDQLFGADGMLANWTKAAFALGTIMLLTMGPKGFMGKIFGVGGTSIWKGFGKTGIKSVTQTVAGETSSEVGKFGSAFKNMPAPATILSTAVAIVALGIAMIGIGFGIKMASEGLTGLVSAFAGLTGGQILGALGALVIVMGGFTGMVIALAGISTVAAIPLLALGAAFLMIGSGIGIAAYGLADLIKSFGTLGKSLSDIGSSGLGTLYGLAGGIIALSAAGVSSVFGIAPLMVTLGALAAVMIVLAPALAVASQSMISMANGVTQLKTAIKGLDTSSLEKLADVSDKLSTASAIQGLIGSISGLAGGNTTPGKQETKEITIKFDPIPLQLNGRTIQELIMNDTKYVL